MGGNGITLTRPWVRRLWIGAALGLGACSTIDLAPPDRPRYEPLFNGVDLSGWTACAGDPRNWSVHDGMLLGQGARNGMLRTTQRFQNFVLRFEWRHLHRGGRAGVSVWADASPTPASPTPRGISIGIANGPNTAWATTHGDLVAEHGAVMVPARVHPRGHMHCLASEFRCHPVGHWNRYQITCQSGVIELTVNGTKVASGSGCKPSHGFIALIHRGDPVHYRNFELVELRQ